MLGLRCWLIISTFKSSKTESKQILEDGRGKDVKSSLNKNKLGSIWIMKAEWDVTERYSHSGYLKPSTKVLLEAESREKVSSD